VARQPPVGQGLLIIEASRSHSDTPHSVGLLWAGDQPEAETSIWHHKTLKTQISMRPAGFEPATPASERPHTHALDRAATGIGNEEYCVMLNVGQRLNRRVTWGVAGEGSTVPRVSAEGNSSARLWDSRHCGQIKTGCALQGVRCWRAPFCVFDYRLLLLLLLLLYCPLPQAISSRHFSWTNGYPHRSGFRSQTAALPVIMCDVPNIAVYCSESIEWV
jgi:hypothetical protein